MRTVDWTNTAIVGSVNYGDKLIKIKKCKKDERITQDTFFHEIAHAILKELEFNHPQITKFRSDEIFVQELGLTLRKTFIDLLKSQEDI